MTRSLAEKLEYLNHALIVWIAGAHGYALIRGIPINKTKHCQIFAVFSRWDMENGIGDGEPFSLDFGSGRTEARNGIRSEVRGVVEKRNGEGSWTETGRD